MSLVTASFLQDPDFINVLYIVAFTLFITGLRMLRGPRTAVRGNQVAAVGMAVAVVATLLIRGNGDWLLMVVGVVIGTAVGIPSARSVKMTAMPQMVALFNGVGGGAVALIAIVEYREHLADFADNAPLDQLIPSLFAAIIGSISFWGSLVAFAKLQELISGRPVKLPGGSLVNAVLLAIAVVIAIVIAAGTESEGLFWLILVSAGALGVLAVLPIGGADMPVVISTLNAFTGLSAAAAGIALDNVVLIVAGMLVGASGSILTKQMADAMNRSIGNVFFSGFGAGGGGVPGAGADDGVDRTVRSTSAADVALQLSYARLVVVVPGYGMAVAQAQRAVADLATALEKRGVEVLFAIHPVAGRMPGHMNVLLAEADVPYDKLKEMDDINPEFARTDVALIIGANDVTNPAARNVTDSPIYGMPILDVDKAGSVIVLKRSMSSGFAGIDNPLFYDQKTQMLFGDAKASVGEVLGEVQDI
jgi:NAD(P) transhydrogenase subunit beta